MCKKVFFIILFLVFFMTAPAFCYDKETYVRVGISDTYFSKYVFSQTDLYSDTGLSVTDSTTGQTFSPENGRISVNFSNGLFDIFDGEILKITGSTGPINIRTTENGTIGIANLKRAGKPAAYRGRIDLVRNPQKKGFAIVNVLNLQNYLKGVVPNEMPVVFGLEALKAQCVAARNYVMKATEKYAPFYDVYDSVASQVYFGAKTEKELSNRAVEETDGLFSLYNGKLILALYSSTAGGYTESYENAFIDKSNGLFSSNPHPYLKAVPDIVGMKSLADEDSAREFYTTKPETYDNDSPLYRWTREWKMDEFVEMLNKTMLEQKSRPNFTENDKFTHLKEVRIKQRGTSGKVMHVEIVTEKGTYTFAKELVLRRLFKKDGKALPSANFVCDSYVDEKGITKIKFTGGGYGHGVGMSQFGAGKMGKKGYKFVDILEHYYSDTTVGTLPIKLTSEYGKNISKQTFFVPSGLNAEVAFSDITGLERINMFVNGQNVKTEFGSFFNRKMNFDISKYLKTGENTVEIEIPAEYNDAKSATFYVRIKGKQQNVHQKYILI